MLFDAELLRQAEALLQACRARGERIATVESCTGGLITALLTEIAGSSDVFERGFVTYANEAKNEMVGVGEELLAEHGAVSAEVARAMAEGGLMRSTAHRVIAVTGVAGPSGGSAQKPVGLVQFGLAVRGQKTHTESHIFSGDRTAIRLATVGKAIELLRPE